MKRFLVILFLLSTMVFGADYTSKLLGDTKGNLIIKENINEVHPFASLTKLMTAVLTVEEIEKGNISINDIVTISKEAEKYKGSSVYIKGGQKVKLIDLLYATLVHSANDAAFSLGYYVSKGDIDNFVVNMNKKAKEIGMLNTTYCTPNGLPTSMTGKGMDRGTAYDMYKLSMYAIKKPKLVEVSGTKSIAILNGKMTIYNRNKLIGKVEGVYGLKTGFHDDSMYNISVVFKKDKVDYITILFGGKNAVFRDAEMTKTINEFVPSALKENITYINDDINLYKKRNTIYSNDEISVITNIIKEGKELNNGSFDKPIVIDR